MTGTEPSPRQGPGQFQWNAGGWFGSQLGSTVWMLIAAVLFLPKEPVAGIVALICFAVPNIFGLLLYRQRHRIAPYPALQGLLLLTGIFTTLFIVYLNLSGLAPAFDLRLSRDQGVVYLLPLLFVGLMLWFHWQERAARRKRQQGQDR